MRATFALLCAVLVAGAWAQSGKPSLIYTRSDIKGADINCNQVDFNGAALNYCKLCEGLANAEAACRLNKRCKAITTDGYCHYLKSSVGPRIYREGYNTLVVSPPSACKA